MAKEFPNEIVVLWDWPTDEDDMQFMAYVTEDEARNEAMGDEQDLAIYRLVKRKKMKVVVE